MNTKVFSKITLLVLFMQVTTLLNSQKVVFAVMPDTQTYLESCPEVLEKQIDWIVSHKDDIDAVIQLGDLTQDNHPLEWYNISKFFELFEKNALRYTFSLGNHDMGSAPGKFADTRNTAMANRHFPLDRMEGKDYWGGCFDGKIDNHYITFRAANADWLVLSLEFGPSDAALDWANSVISKNKDKVVIINTHAYMYSDSTRMGEGDSWLPQHYGIGKDPSDTVNDGEQIWEKLVSKHSNIIAVVSGHVLNTGVGTLISEGESGNKVYQMLSNYQRGADNSQMVKDGYIRLLTIDTTNGQLDVETISTITGGKHPSPQHNFKFNHVDINAYLKN